MTYYLQGAVGHEGTVISAPIASAHTKKHIIIVGNCPCRPGGGGNDESKLVKHTKATVASLASVGLSCSASIVDFATAQYKLSKGLGWKEVCDAPLAARRSELYDFFSAKQLDSMNIASGDDVTIVASGAWVHRGGDLRGGIKQGANPQARGFGLHRERVPAAVS